jgi:hypothetical protein
VVRLALLGTALLMISGALVTDVAGFGLIAALLLWQIKLAPALIQKKAAI